MGCAKTGSPFRDRMQAGISRENEMLNRTFRRNCPQRDDTIIRSYREFMALLHQVQMITEKLSYSFDTITRANRSSRCPPNAQERNFNENSCDYGNTFNLSVVGPPKTTQLGIPEAMGTGITCANFANGMQTFQSGTPQTINTGINHGYCNGLMYPNTMSQLGTPQTWSTGFSHGYSSNGMCTLPSTMAELGTPQAMGTALPGTFIYSNNTPVNSTMSPAMYTMPFSGMQEAPQTIAPPFATGNRCPHCGYPRPPPRISTSNTCPCCPMFSQGSSCEKKSNLPNSNGDGLSPELEFDMFLPINISTGVKNEDGIIKLVPLLVDIIPNEAEKEDSYKQKKLITEPEQSAELQNQTESPETFTNQTGKEEEGDDVTLVEQEPTEPSTLEKEEEGEANRKSVEENKPQ